MAIRKCLMVKFEEDKWEVYIRVIDRSSNNHIKMEAFRICLIG